MKRNYFRSFMFVALGTMIISCSKEDGPMAKPDEKLETTTKAAVTQEYSFTYGAVLPQPGSTKPSTIYFPPKPDDPWNWPSYPYTKILTPTSEYLEETCLVDVSKLENGKTYSQLTNGKLTMGFFQSPYDGDSRFNLVKLKSNSATGWNSSWGVSPNVEGENPDVFYAGINRDDLVIYFSKPLIEFGFEVAPNRKNGDHQISAQYGDWLFDGAKGGAGVVSRSPGGAKLIAVKATKPFTMVMINLGDHPTQDIPANGIALANFRYKLAK